MSHRRRLLLSASVLVLVVTACADASSGAAEPAGDGPRLSAPARNAASAPLLPTDVFALPTFDLDRYEQLLGQLDGTPVVVNIWASWCGPCRAEAPHLADAAERFGDRVQFLGIDILDARPSARAFIEEFGWPYPSVFDPAGDVRDQLGIVGQPATLFYDAGGRLVSTWVGPIGPDELIERIQELR